MKIPIIDATMMQDGKGLVAGVSGDNLTKQITFLLARKTADVDLASFTPLICIEPVQGENYNVLPEMTYDDTQITIIWTLTRFDTQYTGKLYATVKLMQPTADGDICVWQSDRGCFHILSGVAADADADTTPPNALDTAIAQAAAHAASAQQYRDEAQTIKDSTAIEFVVEESRIGLRHVGDAAFVYTDDLKAGRNAFSKVLITSDGGSDATYSECAVADSEQAALRLHIYNGLRFNYTLNGEIYISGDNATDRKMGMMSPDDKKKLDATAKSVADIDTALDAILAIQNELIGGAGV